MPKVILTDARVKVLRPRRTAYDIRDGKLRGFGVRVLPSGRKRFFVHSQHRRGLCCKPDVGVSQIRTTTVLSSCFCVGQTVL